MHHIAAIAARIHLIHAHTNTSIHSSLRVNICLIHAHKHTRSYMNRLADHTPCSCTHRLHTCIALQEQQCYQEKCSYIQYIGTYMHLCTHAQASSRRNCSENAPCSCAKSKETKTASKLLVHARKHSTCMHWLARTKVSMHFDESMCTYTHIHLPRLEGMTAYVHCIHAQSIHTCMHNMSRLANTC
jgi:hypothetical protein